MKGVGTPYFEDKLADQKVDTQSAREKMLNKTYHGSGEYTVIVVRWACVGDNC